MAVTSLKDLISAGYASSNIGKASSKLAANIAHIASGKRINQAFEDIASLAIGTGLQSQVGGLRMAALNVSQASSMLQVADGGMGQIGDILQRMQTLAVQSNSGVLSSAGREGLNAEYQQLAEEINRLSGNTNFNGVNLLDGSLSGGQGLSTATNQSTRATGSLDFTANVGAGQTINLNGVTLTEGVNFNAGATVTQTIDNLVTALNSSTNTALSGASYERVGNSLQITADAAGTAGNQFTINEGASTANAAFSVTGAQVGAGTVFSLQGGIDNGVGGNSVSASGIAGDNLVTGQGQQAASSTITFTSQANIIAGNTIQIDDGNGGLVNFTFVNGAPANNQQIEIGSSLEETLQNAAATLDSYSGNNDFVIRQLDFSVDGNQLVIEGQAPGNVNDAVGAAANIVLGTAGGFISNTTLNNGSNTGVNVSGVTNSAFTGNISGFTATQTGADSLTASVTVGGETYTATISDTTPAANTTVRFNSANGGFFDVQLAAGNGQSVGSQFDADTFASRLDASFSGLNFSQNRNVTNFSATGQLTGASLQLQTDDFSDTGIDSIRVQGAPGVGGGNASFEVTINGEVFRSSNLGTGIGAGETIELTSLTNSNRVISFKNGVNDIDLSSQQSADTFRTNFQNAVGLAANGGGAAFQISNNASETLRLGIDNVGLGGLFANGVGDLLSQGNAAVAFGAVANAINTLTSARADVGSFQAALNYAGANIDSAILNQDAARSVLLDTDLASESTQMALSLLQQQAGIATLAQTNRMFPSILDLLKGN